MDTYQRLMPKKYKISSQTPSNKGLDNLTFKNDKHGKQLSQGFQKTNFHDKKFVKLTSS